MHPIQLYYVGQGLGSLAATAIYALFKHFDCEHFRGPPPPNLPALTESLPPLADTEIVGEIDSDDMAASGDPSMGPMMRALDHCAAALA